MRIIHFVMIMLFVLSCRQSDTIGLEELYGKWNIGKAERNGKETLYLRGGYFIIGGDGTMTINITGEAEKGNYTMERNQLRMNDDKIFIVESLKNDSLIIKYTAASNGQFTFYMVKQKEDAQ